MGGGGATVARAGLIAVYLTGVLGLALRLMFSLIAVSRLRRRSQAVTAGDWLETLDTWRTRFGLRCAVELRRSGDVTVPIVIGFRRSAIIVPTDLIESASAAKRDAILAHELAHIVRGDLGWQLLERVVGAACGSIRSPGTPGGGSAWSASGFATALPFIISAVALTTWKRFWRWPRG